VTVALYIVQYTFLEYFDIQINVSELYGAVCTPDYMCIIVFARHDDIQTLLIWPENKRQAMYVQT